MPLQLTSQQLQTIAADFERDGYALVRGVLNAEEMAPILQQWEHVRDPLRAGETIDGMRRDNFYVHGKLPGAMGEVIEHPTVTSIANQLLGPDVALYINRLNVKDTAFRDLIHLHQDIPYFNGGVEKINFFLALQDINLNNGAMVFVPGSQKLGILDRNTIDIAKHPELDVVIPSLRPGDLIVADIRTWHSSVPNTQSTDRVLLQMMFQPANDGSYYPLSVPEPHLVTGQWRTKKFTPWELLTATSMSQLDGGVGNGMTGAPPAMVPEVPVAVMAAASQPSTVGMIGAVMVVEPPHTALAEPVVPRQPLRAQLKAMVPLSIKRPIKLALMRAMGQPIPASTETAATATYVQADTAPADNARKLPAFFTPSTGPEQVWPLTENHIDWTAEIAHTANYLTRAGKTNVLLACRKPLDAGVLAAATANGLNVKGYVHVLNPGEPDFAPREPLPTYKPEQLKQVSGIDAVVVVASMDFGLVMRRCEQFLRSDILFVPATREAIVAAPVRELGIGEWGGRSSILHYLYVSGLRGHFAEFGTFWGRAFFNSYYELNHWLQGKFYAFDSFEGLSEPDPREKAYTSGDFIKGAYGFNHDSFRALGDILEIPRERLITVPGFFDKSLTPQKAAELGLTPKSLSVCRIDCDLLDPTLSVLDFIAPLLDDGALVYFDDWRLCRADPNVGERGAVLRWLKANPSFELVEFPSIHWQHQWFIFHRDRQV